MYESSCVYMYLRLILIKWYLYVTAISHDMMFDRFSVTMEQSGSDNKRATESLRQKRSYSVLRECEAGSSVAHLDERQSKRMRGDDHGDFQYLIEHKATGIHAHCKPYAKEQHEAVIAGRGILCIVPVCSVVY